MDKNKKSSMINKDTVTLLNIIFFFFLSFFIFPFLVLYKKIVFFPWIQKALFFIIVLLGFLPDFLKEGRKKDRLVEISDRILFWVVIPSLIWVSISLHLNK